MVDCKTWPNFSKYYKTNLLMEDDVSNPFRRIHSIFSHSARLREKKLVYLFDIQARGEGVALLLSSERMAESVPSMADSSAAASIQIVYTKRPQDKEPEAYHIRTLASVLGSEDAAKEALLYNYNTVASGFSAKLTPQQAEQISKLLGVLQVVPNMKVQLHTGPRIGRLH
uniref:Inhibitor I9 domain-containing protein n=1 Tax=Salix viminalis TaxID=40686 RepID=A0A6N2LMD5_SALVM